MKLTRRELVIAAGSVTAMQALAQAPATQPQSARDDVQRNGETLAKFGIPMATEPAFQFKA